MCLFVHSLFMSRASEYVSLITTTEKDGFDGIICHGWNFFEIIQSFRRIRPRHLRLMPSITKRMNPCTQWLTYDFLGDRDEQGRRIVFLSTAAGERHWFYHIRLAHRRQPTVGWVSMVMVMLMPLLSLSVLKSISSDKLIESRSHSVVIGATTRKRTLAHLHGEVYGQLLTEKTVAPTTRMILIEQAHSDHDSNS